jgi:hypothetical protein
VLSASPAGYAHTITTSTCGPALPCSDVREGAVRCPDLAVDPAILARDLAIERRTFAPEECTVIEGEVEAGSRRLLIFTSNTPNLGPGDLIVGDPSLHPELFEFETCHGHPHFREYADYRLWRRHGYDRWLKIKAEHPGACARDILAGHPELRPFLVSGQKRGFCVIDIWPSALPCTNPEEPSKYLACESFPPFFIGNQGISVCWADEYDTFLDGQWIDITGLRGGRYVLEVEVNAEHLFEEADYSNDSAVFPLFIPRESRQ